MVASTVSLPAYAAAPTSIQYQSIKPFQPSIEDTIPINKSAWQFCNDEAIAAWKDQNDLEKARQLFVGAVNVAESIVGHQGRLAYSLDLLIYVCMESERYEDAEMYAFRAVPLIQNLYGKKDLRAINCMNNLAGALYAQGRFAEAEPLTVIVLTEYNKQLGPTHESVGTAANNLAMIYHAQAKYSLAEIMYERALPILRTTHGERRKIVTHLMENYAAVLEETGNFKIQEQVLADLRESGIWKLFKHQNELRLTA